MAPHHTRHRGGWPLWLLLLLGLSSWHQHRCSSPFLLTLAAAQSSEGTAPTSSSSAQPSRAVSGGGTVVVHKNTSAGDPPEGFVAQGTLKYRADSPWFGKAGVGGRWDGFDYADARNSYPSRYCPSGCRSVSTRVARCGCVTRASLNTYYSGRRWGTWSYPVCCYLPNHGGGGSSSGGASNGGASGGGSTGGASGGGSNGGASSGGGGSSGGGTATQRLTLQLFAMGSCSDNGLRVVRETLKGYIATLPGVVGSSVTITTSAKVLSLSRASAVVKASAAKVAAKAAAAAAQSSPDSVQPAAAGKLPPQINPNVVCAVNVDTAFVGPASSMSTFNSLWTIGGPCNKIFNNMCGSYYTMESTMGCISEPSETPIQYGSCEDLSRSAGPTPTPTPSPPPPPSGLPSPPPPPGALPSPPPPPGALPSPPPPPGVRPSPPPPPGVLPSPPPPPGVFPSPPPPPRASPPPPPPRASPPPPVQPSPPPPPPPVPEPEPEPSPSPSPLQPSDKEALLRSVQENPQMKEFLESGWEAKFELCNGPQTQETFWTGIYCLDPINKPGLVKEIALSQSPFKGPAPPSWGDLVQPLAIDASYNYMTGALPAKWGALSTLVTLNLENNRQLWAPDGVSPISGLKGPIPADWSTLSSLQTLKLAGNSLIGTFPAAEFNALTKVSFLNVDRNKQLSGFLPGTWRERGLKMTYAVAWDEDTGFTIDRGPDTYGSGGGVLYTGSGPLWRTLIIGWEGSANNSAVNPNPQPSPDPCKVDPLNSICL